MRRPFAVLMLAMLAGCAPVQPPGATTIAQPASPPSASGSATGSGAARTGVAVGNTASGGSIVTSGSQPTVVDSGPSAEALAVLATIPEPLSSSARVPPPSATPTGAAGKKATGTTGTRTATGGAAGATAAGGAAAGASAGAASSAAAGAATGAAAGASGGAAAGAAAGAGAGAVAAAGVAASAGAAGARPDSARGDVADSAATTAAEDSLIPVPVPTEPLGERPGTLARVVADTFPVMPPPPPPSPAPARAGPDSCWRIQVAAPTSKPEADLKRQAAESVLLVPFVIDHEKQRYKVRNRDCLTREVADRLRRRAIQSGFEGTFPVVEVRK